VKRLKAQSVVAVAMHGDKTQSQRQKALQRFEDGHVATLVATDVAARGIDVDDITRVINFDVPEDRDTFVHRTGRTGRAGRSGTSLSFVMPDQVGEMKKIASELGLSHDLRSNGDRPAKQSPRPAPARRRQPSSRRRRSSSKRG